MGESVEIRRKRLRFRSWHRGTKETDLLLGSFADVHLAMLSPAQLDRYEALLESSDDVIFDWITGRTAVPSERDDDILRLLANFRYCPGSA